MDKCKEHIVAIKWGYEDSSYTGGFLTRKELNNELWHYPDLNYDELLFCPDCGHYNLEKDVYEKR